MIVATEPKYVAFWVRPVWGDGQWDEFRPRAIRQAELSMGEPIARWEWQAWDDGHIGMVGFNTEAGRSWNKEKAASG